MNETYVLKKGTYIICDPGLIVNKYSKKGSIFLEKLWDKFYKHPKDFQYLKIKGIKFYISKTNQEDGIFDGIATETGVLMIINEKALKNKQIFKEKYQEKFTKKISYDHESKVYVKDFNIYLKGFTIKT